MGIMGNVCKALKGGQMDEVIFEKMSHSHQLMQLFQVITKSLKTLLLKTILHVSIRLDHHQGFFLVELLIFNL